MASVQKISGKKGDRWKAVVRRKGFGTQTQTFGKKKDAETWARSIDTRIDSGALLVSSETRKATVAELIDRYISDVLPQKKSGRVQKQQLLRWRDLLGEVRLMALTPYRILQARAEIMAQITRNGVPVSNATVNRYHAALSHVLKVAEMQYGLIESNPIRKVPKLKEPQGRVRYLTADEQIALLTACEQDSNPLLPTIVMMAIATGMRKGEVLNLKWSDVDLSRQTALIEEPKNGQRRSVFLVEKIVRLIEALKESAGGKSEYLFPGRSNLKPIDISSAWQRAVKAANLKDFRFHDLRHTAGSYLAMDGASILQISAVLGQRSPQMASRYAHLSDASTQGVLNKTMSKVFGDADD